LIDLQNRALAIEAEARWEVEGINRAVARYREAAKHKTPAELPSGQALLRELVGPLSEAIRQAQAKAAEEHASAGRPAPHGWAIQLLEADQLAVITVATALRPDRSGDAIPLTNMASMIGSAVRLQVEFDRWVDAKDGTPPDASADRFLRKLLAKQPERATRLWPKWRRKVVETREAPWSASLRISLGCALLRLLVDTAPSRFSIDTRVITGNRTQAVLQVSDETLTELQQREARAEVARPLLLPMIVPPNEWKYEEAA
jgi:hypothetical protein